MKIAIIGQSVFASSVYEVLRENGHKIVGIFTIPDNCKGKEDPLATAGKAGGVPVFKVPRWRLKGETIPSVLADYQSVEAELNVLPYCSQFIPMEIINAPKHRSICYHPSLLPKHRGAASINWTLIEGDRRGGFTVFWPDDGLDTGPILLQSGVDLEENETVESLYNRFLFPEGVEGIGEAVELIAAGKAPSIVQPQEGASYEPMLNKKELTRLNLEGLSGARVHNFIRGCDKVPGAWIVLDGAEVKVYGATLWKGKVPAGLEVKVEGMSRPGIVYPAGLLLFGQDGQAVSVAKLGLESGKMIPVHKYGKESEKSELGTLSPEEEDLGSVIQKIWSAILSIDIEPETDFFGGGAGSMDVTRMVEEIRDKVGLELDTTDVYMATTYAEFFELAVLQSRGGSRKSQLVFDGINVHANNLDLVLPHHLFINNEFVEGSDPSRKLTIINPTDESVICQVDAATKEDVDLAVTAAEAAFYDSEWSRMNARDRGKLLYRLAELMEEHKEELATIESIDSGAVYTLALKTHVGMSIDTWRYFAGWCDKIEGKTIPINHARPRKNLTYTKREPIGVCGLITPWNYPLMMVSWKMAACLAAGNTVVLKPPQACPLTALKLAQLSVEAGFPPGVINVLPGTGSACGQAISDHPKIRKLGFTGSTPIGQQIMKSCAVSNVKKVSLELGGKSPLVIFSDCDLDQAIRQAMGAVFFNKGENCIAAGRIFVEESLHQTFVRRVKVETRKIKIGDPLDRATAHGPQNHRAHLEKLVEYCDIGVKEGAKLVYGGYQLKMPGLYFMPTIFTGVEDSMYIAQEESFGPIMIISTFPDGDVKGVLERANATEFGLAAGVFTKDMGKALTFADGIVAGTCFINCYNKTDVAAPFGGFKQSGFGKDLGEEALNEYLKTKTITVEY